ALSEAERRALLTDPALATLQGVFAAVPDPRKRRGLRYDLPFLLTCLAAALLSNCNSLAAVGQWCQEHRTLLGRRYPQARFLTPTGALYRWLLPRLSVAELEWALAGWVRASRAVWEREALALDGKTVRGAAGRQPDGTSTAPHLLSVSGHQSHATLLQVRVDGKTNEIPVAQALLSYLPVRGRIVTADALHTQTAFAQGVLDQGGDYLLCVKGNQPTLYDDIALAFADPATACSSPVSTTDCQRGRTEVRRLRTTTCLNTYITALPRVGQVAEVTRTVTHQGRTTKEVVFLVTSRPPALGSPTHLLAWIRGHWSIEARHNVRDGTFGEDHSRLRHGHAPQIMAACRNLCITLLHRTGHHAISQARRSFAYHPAQALALLLPKARRA
ncbi:MAG TPA: ISAs1 family transposase, partial [Solirubrobacteraceae bacterium]